MIPQAFNAAFQGPGRDTAKDFQETGTQVIGGFIGTEMTGGMSAAASMGMAASKGIGGLGT